MALTQEKITSLHKLTALRGGEKLNIESVLDSFSQLQDIEISPDLKVTRSGQGVLLPRPDIVSLSPPLSDRLLACSSQRVVGHQIALMSIMQAE